MRLFTDVLRETRNGALVDELSAQLTELTKAVVETGKKGTLNLTLSIAPAKGGAYVVTDEVKLKAPEHDKEATLFFVSNQGDLLRNDPNQITLGLRAVDEPEENSGEVKQI